MFYDTLTVAPLFCSIFKQLVIYSPRNCVWVFTGSRMASMWANMVLAPTNGYTLHTHCRTVYLPTTVPTNVKEEAWNILQQQYGGALPPAIYNYAPMHHAGLAFLCSEWQLYYKQGVEDITRFCTRTIESKIHLEVRQEEMRPKGQGVQCPTADYEVLAGFGGLACRGGVLAR